MEWSWWLQAIQSWELLWRALLFLSWQSIGVRRVQGVPFKTQPNNCTQAGLPSCWLSQPPPRSTQINVIVMVERLILLLCILEVPGSNLGPKTSYPDTFVVVFSVSPGECRNSTLKLGHDRFLRNRLQFITYHPFIRRCIVSVAEKRY
jgi:hypothetical protein